MFRTVTSRLRGIETTLRHEERMAALGRMAAQLMHELNNPAAAVGRTSQALTEINRQLGQQAIALASNLGDGVELTPREAPGDLSPLDRSEREDDLVGWMEELGIDEAWDLGSWSRGSRLDTRSVSGRRSRSGGRHPTKARPMARFAIDSRSTHR